MDGQIHKSNTGAEGREASLGAAEMHIVFTAYRSWLRKNEGALEIWIAGTVRPFLSKIHKGTLPLNLGKAGVPPLRLKHVLH